MRIVLITVAFCPAVQLAHALLKFKKCYAIPHPLQLVTNEKFEHYVINGHYPVDINRNYHNLRMITKAYGAEWLDPGRDLGSAQTQNWALKKLNLKDEDYFVNYDPDSSCLKFDWLEALYYPLLKDPHLGITHLNSRTVEKEMILRQICYSDREIAGFKVRIIPKFYMQFNISMWKMGVVREMGGIPQAFPHYGGVEMPTQMKLRTMKMYDGYLIDYVEDPTGKFLQDDLFFKWKYAHTQQDSFKGNFKEFVEWSLTSSGAAEVAKLPQYEVS